MNMVGTSAFREGRKEIADKLLRRHFLAGVGMAFLIAVLEVVLYFVEESAGLLQDGQTAYLYRCVLLPTGLDIVAVCIVLGVWRFLKNNRVMAYAVSLMHMFFAFIVYSTHIQFPSLYIFFAIAILLTTAYGDVVMTSIVTALSIILKVISDISPAAYPIRSLSSAIDFRLERQNFIVSLIALGAFYIICLVMIAIEREKNALGIQQERENVQLFQKIMTDTLTGVHNRNALRLSFDRVIADKTDTEYVLAMLDIDYFKNVNDTFGHLVGDSYLQALGRVLDHVPDAEAFRFGGDEFCLLFAGCTRKQVEERCRTAQEKFLGNDLCRKYAEVNVSFGLAQYDRKITPSEWVQHADHALYEAKKNRGSICFYQPEETE